MIFGILLIGIILIDTSLKGTNKELGDQLAADFLGTDGFMLWAGSFVGVGLIGYIPGLQRTSHYLLALLIVVIVVRNQGLFAQAQDALLVASKKGPAPAQPPPADPSSSSGSGSSSGGSGAGGAGSTIAELAPLALMLL